MAKAIGRIRTLGIARQTTFGTAEASATYVMPLLEPASIVPDVRKLENNSALGSAYRNNDIVNGTRNATISLQVKIDEDQLPLFYSQRFSVSSVTASGETTVYEHTLSYTNSTQNWFTIFLQDDNLNDYVMKDVLFSQINHTLDQEFFRASIEAIGAFPVTGSVTNIATQPKDFVGRHGTFLLYDHAATVATASILSAEVNHEFGTTGDEDNFNIGNQDLATHVLTDDLFETNVTLLHDADTNWNEHRDNTKKAWQVVLESTDRFVTGSVASTRPYINFTYPVGFIKDWSEETPMDALVKETLMLSATDEVGVSNAPEQIVVRNAVASY